MTPQDLIAFENDIAAIYETGAIKGPVHLSGGNETQLINIFKEIRPTDWVFSNWRSHYHALLHGIPPEKVKSEILAGRSISLQFPEHHFYTSAIVGGILPIAVGAALALSRVVHKSGTAIVNAPRVWCFLGDMTAHTGIYMECFSYAKAHNLPIIFTVEDNRLSVKTPTESTWPNSHVFSDCEYRYVPTWPHSGIGKRIDF